MAESPIHAAADSQVIPLSLVLIGAVGDARQAVDLGAVEAALARGDAAEAVALLEPALEALLAALDGPEAAKAAKAMPGVGDVLGDALAAGAQATELCVVGNDLTQSVAMASKPIAAVDRRGSVWHVRFADDSKAVFKVTASESKESAMRLLAEDLDAKSLLPAMARRTVDGESGLLFEFAEGQSGAALGRTVKYGTGQDLPKAGVMDFVLSNGDRNGNNWIVSQGRLRLIDHDSLGASRMHSDLFEHMREVEDMVNAGEMTKPLWFRSPREVVAGVDAAALGKRLSAVGVSEADVARATEKLRLASGAETWEHLFQAR